MWACGRGDVSTPSFDSHVNPILTGGADYAHQVLKATGAPVLCKLQLSISANRSPCKEETKRYTVWP
jgi:hypothetical protein